MVRLFVVMLCLACFTSWAQQALEKKPAKPIDPDRTEIQFQTKDQFTLTADYFAGKKFGGGALLLHDCESDRRIYDGLGRLLKQKGIHTIALDFRGYGKSVSKRYNHKMLKKQAKNLVDYQNDVTFLTSFWSKDVLQVLQFLRNKVDKNKQLAIVASGCAGKYAIAAAEQIHLGGLVLISADLDYLEKENYKNLNDIATYFINSTSQPQVYKTAEELFKWNGHRNSKLQTYNNNYYGFGLLQHDKALGNDIAFWLADQL